MTLAIGIDQSRGTWKTCLMENEHVLELRQFSTVGTTIGYVRSICAFYPEPIVVFSPGYPAYDPTAPGIAAWLQQQTAGQFGGHTATEVDFLRTISSFSHTAFLLPGLHAVPTVPIFRRHYRFDLGSSHQLCVGATLLYRMRLQSAAWQEMNFLLLLANANSRSILVVEDGCIVNGIGEIAATGACLEGSALQEESADWSEQLVRGQHAEMEFWEGLTQDLAGLMAIHHLEDIVLLGERKEAVTAHLQEMYQFYLFPQDGDVPEGYEAALGAALISEGLSQPGLPAEVVAHLQIDQACLNSDSLSTNPH